MPAYSEKYFSFSIDFEYNRIFCCIDYNLQIVNLLLYYKSISKLVIIKSLVIEFKVCSNKKFDHEFKVTES